MIYTFTLSAHVQVVLVGFVCFCSVGMFSAISNLGAGGTQDPQLSSTANACLVCMLAQAVLTMLMSSTPPLPWAVS